MPPSSNISALGSTNSSLLPVNKLSFHQRLHEAANIVVLLFPEELNICYKNRTLQLKVLHSAHTSKQDIVLVMQLFLFDYTGWPGKCVLDFRGRFLS